MDEFSIQLNDVLVETFRSILKVEELTLKSYAKEELTVSELHLIEAVGKGGDRGITISDISKDLEITMPSVTVAINKLQRKGLVQKVKSESDGRVVYVILTKTGHRVEAVHRYFHENMVRNVVKGITEEEKQAMLKGITKLNEFFRKKIAALED